MCTSTQHLSWILCSNREGIKPDLVSLILDGSKVSTWRLWDDKDLQLGDQITLIKRPELTPFATAEIINVLEKPIGKMTEEEKQGHEKFLSDDVMYKTYSDYYQREVKSDTIIKIIFFKLIQRL